MAIVSVTNLPAHEVPFADIRDTVLDLIEGEYGLRVAEIQRCPFGRGQAFVRLGRVSDRDSLIHHSPHQFHGWLLDFVGHNRGDIARRVLFNHECWLMLIGYPTDDRNIDDIRNAIKSFGRLILWQKDNVLGRIIIKARVTDLGDVPHYIILSEGDDFEGVSHTVQCEIIQQNILGGQLPDEDIPPGGFDDGEFVFPGFKPIPLNQQQIQQNQQNQFQQANGLPDLNDVPMEDVQHQLEDGILEEDNVNQDFNPAAQPNELPIQQHVLDLQLSLSIPPVSCSDSMTGGIQQGVESSQRGLELGQGSEELQHYSTEHIPEEQQQFVLSLPTMLQPMGEAHEGQEAQNFMQEVNELEQHQAHAPIPVVQGRWRMVF